MVKIIFLHPDLGVGGAERLVLDAGLAFKSKGHDVIYYTNHHDPSHCFAETRNGTFPVNVVGDWIPRSIFGRFKAACAYARMVFAAIYLAWYVIPAEEPTLIFCDLISLCIPFLKLARGPHRIVFYCHHPDKLLSAEGGFLKKLYRAPLNWLEELTTARADKVLVNSKYTARVYKDAFQKIKDIPDICYPSINTEFFKSAVPKAIKEILPIELTDLTAELDLEEKVTLMKSPRDLEKVSLLYNCKALIYTPSNEHFGIVPLEAMYYSKPVIAVNSGGPTETIVNEVTGFLCEPTSESFAKAMCTLMTDPELCRKLGEAGRKRFDTKFSFEAFTNQIEGILTRERQVISEARAIEYEKKNK
ncbi:putative AHPC/TSA protein [Danaus plexippus plexippus]|uniref:Alpha-1,3/1,6-mannosyltransferase ALG2 n=1 Tax=Danaus plexippus plexippus TaxID=278856 RepID=A0A212FFK9_DANPL|nr:putative AHPC/TSA protein [Danaus plexippus plexippus]